MLSITLRELRSPLHLRITGRFANTFVRLPFFWKRRAVFRWCVSRRMWKNVFRAESAAGYARWMWSRTFHLRNDRIARSVSYVLRVCRTVRPRHWIWGWKENRTCNKLQVRFSMIYRVYNSSTSSAESPVALVISTAPTPRYFRFFAISRFSFAAPFSSPTASP